MKKDPEVRRDMSVILAAGCRRGESVSVGRRFGRCGRDVRRKKIRQRTIRCRRSSEGPAEAQSIAKVDTMTCFSSRLFGLETVIPYSPAGVSSRVIR